MILAPDVRGEEVVERRNRPAPRDRARGLQPLGVLVEHRVDDVDECLVAVEQPVPAGQQIALEPALAEVLAQDLHHAAVGRQVVVPGLDLGAPRPVGHLEHVGQAIGGGLVRSEEPEVPAALVEPEHVAQVAPEHAGGLAGRTRRRRDLHGVVAVVRQLEVARQEPAVGVRVCPHPALPGGGQRAELWAQGAALVEQLLGPVAPHPLVELCQVLGVGAHGRQRHLVRAVGALGRQAVHLLRAGPALGRPQHDHRPARPRGAVAVAGGPLDVADLADRLVQRLAPSARASPRGRSPRRTAGRCP